MKYPSLQIASQIAKVCRASDLRYNNTKIQKLLYCCYGCTLVALSDRLCDEYPRAWQFGPVFPRVFKYIKDGKSLADDSIALVGASDESLQLIEKVVRDFGIYTAQSLSAWTHRPGSPWDKVINEMGEPIGSFIPDDMIADYFRKNIVRMAGDAA